MAKISGGGRKIGRNKEGCAEYKKEHRREKNKIRKWKKMLKGLLDNNETAIELKNKIKKLEEEVIK
ncbi:hypothetical protein ES695_14955 [Candidatus Atribacteria bacterium 1244-E10-H5-B2]|nr:MAG: hypothetical protein ES695_14955 [Candidatus Atribacteria bacterium 1244-E10-H5-B2]